MEEKKKSIVVAVTGGICSGKSTIMKTLEEEGAPVISCDEEIRKIKTIPQIADLIAKEFPGAAKDNKKLAEIVFSNPDKRKILEAILYPELYKAVDEFIKSRKERVVFVEIPLLYEKAKEKLYNKVILVKCSKESQKQRAMNRGISMLIFEKITSSQLPVEKKESKANYIIDTDHSFVKVREEVLKIYREIENE